MMRTSGRGSAVKETVAKNHKWAYLWLKMCINKKAMKYASDSGSDLSISVANPQITGALLWSFFVLYSAT